MKDMDFLKFGRAIKLGPVNRDLFLNQIERDVNVVFSFHLLLSFFSSYRFEEL
jgi:hypothetical protein